LLGHLGEFSVFHFQGWRVKYPVKGGRMASPFMAL